MNLAALVEGRSVAVVGNSSSLFDNKFGKEIDDHDVVIRFNKAAPMMMNDTIETHGERLDVWAFWAIGAFYRGVIEKEDESSRLSRIFHDTCSSKKIQLFRSNYARDVSKNHSFDTLPLRNFKELQKSIHHLKIYSARENTRIQNNLMIQKNIKINVMQPSAGVGVLFWLKLCKPKSVHIYGMDFKKTPTFSEKDLYQRDMVGRVDVRCKHNFEIEEYYVRNEILRDKRFKLK